jgi:hypothetical protein
MKSLMYRRPRAIRLFTDSPHRVASATRAKTSLAWPRRTLLALTLIILALLGQQKLVAQQDADNSGWSQNGDYNQQYPSDQPSDVQPGYGQQPYPDSNQSYPQQGYGQPPPVQQPLNAGQLEQLLAPIALYPDTLVAQLLAASTYPAQVADADRWRQAQGYAPPEQIVAGADAQPWDPSVKALTAFPQVLAQMARNLRWTTDLGNAYYNQPQDVLEAVQVMRRRAQAAGTLQSTPQEAVRYEQGYIQLVPVNPQVVYVPTYNPWTVYGEPVTPYPGFSLLGAVESFLGSSPLKYGLGIAMSAFTHTPWGWLAWGLNWLAQAIFFHDSNYHSHSTTVADWGFRHEGFHAYAGRGIYARPIRGDGRGPEHFGRFGGRYDASRGHEFARPPDHYAQNWRGNSNRGFQSFRGGYDHSPRQAYNHMPENRQPFDRGRNFGSNFNRGSDYRGPEQSFRGRSGFGNSMPAYRPPSSGFQHGQFADRSSAFAGRDYARASKPPRSGGFHLFGGGHEHAPKSVSSRGFGGGFHGGGGGHPPKMHGGGHSFGGGGHFHGGGSHSGGHGGGKHHR